MFDFDKDLSNAKLCELFIEHGKLMSDGVDIIQKVGNLYQPIRPQDIALTMRELITRDTRFELSTNRLESIMDLIKQNPDIRVNPDISNLGKIIFRNGVYNVADGKLYPPDNRYHWAVVDADYKEKVSLKDAPVFSKFLESSLDFKKDEKKATLLLEVIGYCLSDYTVAKKGFFFIGEPSTGKSKILEFLQKLIGDNSVSQILLPLISSRFSLGQLYGKRLNVCTELPSNKFPSIDVFKALTAGDRVYGELKGKDGFSYYPHVRLLNAGNCVPIPQKIDGTSSIIERMVFLLFNKTIPQKEWNVNLVDDLLDERNMICSLAVRELKKLVERNFQFTLPEDSRQFAASYRDTLEAFKLFVTEACERRDNVWVSSQQLWDCYVEFCNNNNFPRGITIQLFAQKLEALEGVKKQRKRIGGRHITIFIGITIRSAFDDVEDEIKRKVGLKNNKDFSDKIRKEPTNVTNRKSSCTVAQGKFNVESSFWS